MDEGYKFDECKIQNTKYFVPANPSQASTLTKYNLATAIQRAANGAAHLVKPISGHRRIKEKF